MNRTRTSPERVTRNTARAPETTSVTDTTLGTAIRARRLALGLHQETLAARAGLDHRVLSRLERGERPCRFTEFVALAEALNISASNLLKLAFGTEKEPAA